MNSKEQIIIKNKHSDYHIVYNKEAEESIRYAAMELQKYLYLSTDACLGVFSDKCPKRSKEIILGKEVRGINYDHFLQNLSNEGFVIKMDSFYNILILSLSGRGVLYGVYYFLEKFINLKCFHKDQINFDLIDLLVIRDLNIKKDFIFEYREVYFTDAFDGVFASMNMLNSNLANLSDKYGNKMKWFNFHHSFSDLINVNEYYKIHPEYFSEINGKRIKEHTELCLSNPDVLNLSIKKIRQWLEENKNISVISVAQDEWMGHFIKMACECKNCKEIDEKYQSQSGSIINFVNKIAENLQKDYPNVLIHTFAYQYSRKPPIGIKPHKNVIVRLCNIECSWSEGIEEGALKNETGRNALFLKDLIGWSKLCNRLYIWDYLVNFRNYLLPFPCLRTLYKNIETYKKYNIKGLLMEGNFSFGGKGYIDELKSYLIAKLITGDQRNLETIIKEFCHYFYGEAETFVYEYIFLFEDCIQGHDLWLYDDSDSNYFNDELISKGKEIINAALKSVKNDQKLYERVKQLELGIKYLEISRMELGEERNKLVDLFEEEVRKLKITELFERTQLDYSFKIMKNSRYCKERPDWYSLYYIMK